MKKTEYECNLCGDVYSEKDARENMKNYYCVKQKFPTGSDFEIRELNKDSCDRHICIRCIHAVKITI